MIRKKVPFPATGRLLGLDYGTKRFGVAISNDEQSIASPLENRTRQTPEADAAFLLKIAKEYEAVGLVVGLPVHKSGQEGGKAGEARRFGAWAGKATGLPVRYADERYSSLIAEQHLRGASLSDKKLKARLDKVAAQVLLQAYLDSPDRAAPPAPLDRTDVTTASTPNEKRASESVAAPVKVETDLS